MFAAFEDQLRDQSYRPADGQIADATLIAAPRQRMTKEEKEPAKVGESAATIAYPI